MTRTLIAIDATYRRWADILDLVRAGRMEEARALLVVRQCPLCAFAVECPSCPIVVEYNLYCSDNWFFFRPCDSISVFTKANEGVNRRDNSAKTISALVKLLWLLDCLWKRVRKHGGL